MKYSCFFLALLFSFNMETSAQKFEKKTDKFTGKTTEYTPLETIYRRLGAGQAGEKVEYSLMKINDSLYLYLNIRKGGSGLYQINEGQAAYLKPLGGESIKLKAAATQVSETLMQADGALISNLYYLDGAALDMLRKNDLEGIRVEHQSGNFDYELKGKFAGTIRKALNQ